MVTSESIRKVLLGAAELIEPEGCWTRFLLAADAAGFRTPIHGDLAVCYCADGAIRVSAARVHRSDMVERMVAKEYAIECLARAIDPGSDYLPDDIVHAWNDDPARTQSEVVAALRKAAAEVT